MSPPALGQVPSSQPCHDCRLVHLVYGLSKDWGCSGLRVGVLYSRNVGVQQVIIWGMGRGWASAVLNCLQPIDLASLAPDRCTPLNACRP